MLSPLDWVILGVIAISAVFFILRGFVKEASSIISWVVAFAVTSKCYPMVEPYLTFSNDQLTRNVVACIALFVISLLIFGFISNIICSAIKKVGLSGFDRLLGIAFGIARGILIVTAVLALFHMLFRLHILTFIQSYSWYQDSVFVPELQRIVNWFFDYIRTPESIGA